MARSRFFFVDEADAAEALIKVLTYAREIKDSQFNFGPLKADAILESGLWLEGQIDELAAILEQDSAAVRHDE